MRVLCTLCAVLPALGFAAPAGAAQAASPAQIERPQIERLVRELDSDEWAAREKASAALKDIGAPARPALEQALDHGSPEVRWRVREILRAIRFIPPPELRARLGKDLVKSLQGFDQLQPRARKDVLNRAYQRLGRKLASILAAVLAYDDDAGVRYTALSLLGTSGAEEEIIAALPKLPQELQSSAARYLVRIGSERSLEVVRKIAESGKPERRRTALAALATRGDAADADRFARVLRDALDAGVPTPLLLTGLNGVGRCFRAEDRALVRKFLKHEDSRVRQTAIYTCMQLNDIGAADQIAVLLDDSGAGVKNAAITTLSRLRARQHEGKLIKLLDSPASDVRIAACMALGQFRLPSSRDALLKRLSGDSDYNVRRSALDALVWIADKKTLRVIDGVASGAGTQPNAPSEKTPVRATRRPRRGGMDGNVYSLRLAGAEALLKRGLDIGAQRLMELAKANTASFVPAHIAGILAQYDRREEILTLRRAKAGKGRRKAVPAGPGVQTGPAENKEPAADETYDSQFDPILCRLGVRAHFAETLRERLLALEGSPGSARANTMVGQFLTSSGLHDLAVKFHKRATKIEPTGASAWMRYAMASLDAGRYADCEAAYKRMLRHGGSRQLYANNLAWLYVTAHDAKFIRPGEATKLVRQSLAREPNSPYYLDTLGWAFFRAGKHGDAASLLRASLNEFEPGRGGARGGEHARLARALHAAGKTKEAKVQLETAQRECRRSGEGMAEIGIAWAEIGDAERAAKSLERAFERGYVDLHRMQHDHAMDGIRKHEGFRKVLSRIQAEHDRLRKLAVAEIARHVKEAPKGEAADGAVQMLQSLDLLFDDR